MTAHNHAPWEGEGLGCPELRLPNGDVKGKCIVKDDLIKGVISPNMFREIIWRNELMISSEGFNNPGTDMTDEEGPTLAKKAVRRVIDRQAQSRGENPPAYELRVVWFAYILGNRKALVSTDVSDGKYFEVTRNAAMQETYVDEYVKRMNHVIQD